MAKPHPPIVGDAGLSARSVPKTIGVEIEYVLAPHQRDAIAPVMERLRPIFPRWTKTLSVRYDPGTNDLANITPLYEYRALHVRIGDGWFSECEEQRASHLAHELAHASVSPLAQQAEAMMNAYTSEDSPERKLVSRGLEMAEEACVTDLSNIFMGLLK